MSKSQREERRYSVPQGPNTPLPPAASEDLHAWSIYRYYIDFINQFFCRLIEINFQFIIVY